MTKQKNLIIDHEKYLDLIRLDARNINQTPIEIRQQEEFIVNALKTNSLTVRFLTEEEKNNDFIAFNLAFIIKNYESVIGKKLEDENFYITFIKQKIKNKDTNNVYINKSFFSKKENVINLLNEVNVYSLNYISKELKDDEELVYIFCERNELNQIYVSERISKEAALTGTNVLTYLKKKLYYKDLNEKFPNKHKDKKNKI